MRFRLVLEFYSRPLHVGQTQEVSGRVWAGCVAFWPRFTLQWEGFGGRSRVSDQTWIVVCTRNATTPPQPFTAHVAAHGQARPPIPAHFREGSCPGVRPRRWAFPRGRACVPLRRRSQCLGAEPLRGAGSSRGPAPCCQRRGSLCVSQPCWGGGRLVIVLARN